MNHLAQFEAVFATPAKQLFTFLKPLVEIAMMLQFMLMLAHDHGIRTITRNVAIMLVSVYCMNHFQEALSSFQKSIRSGVIATLKADPGSVQAQFAQALSDASKNGPHASRFSLESMRNAVISAFMFLFGLGAQVVQIGMTYAQRFFSIAAYALSPIWFALFALDSQRGLATKAGLHIFALCCWPISWAVGSLGTRFLLASMASVKGEIGSAVAIVTAEWVDLPILGFIAFYNLGVVIFGPIVLHILIPGGGHFALHAAQAAVSKVSSAISNITSRK